MPADQPLQVWAVECPSRYRCFCGLLMLVVFVLVGSAAALHMLPLMELL
jgi:hypothetical protein